MMVLERQKSWMTQSRCCHDLPAGCNTGVLGLIQFKPTVQSLQHYQCPEWFRDAKFGIYLHWGAYSVVERGEWYARKLYEEGGEDYAYHLEHYGHPSEFGYKDFIPLWKAERL